MLEFVRSRAHGKFYGFSRESRIFAVNEFYVKHSAQNLIFTCQEELSGSRKFCKCESACSTKRNRPLALTGHVTNASLKVVILLLPKIDRTHKNYLTREIWEETHLREIFYGTLIFQQSSMICLGRHVEGHTLALQHGGQNYFLLISF